MNHFTTDAATFDLLAEIIADANRMSPEQVAEIITDAEWYGTPDDAEDHPVGHYVENHLNRATGRHHLVWIIHHDIIVMDLHTRKTLATIRMSTTSTLADVIDLIDEGVEGFTELVDTRALDRARLTDAERAEIADDAAFTVPVARSHNDDYMDAINALHASIAA